MGAVQFIENLDRTSLTISDEDFEKNVEAAVSAIAEKHQAEVAEVPPPTHLSEKSTLSRPGVTPRHSMEGESSVPRKSTSSNEYDSGDGLDEKGAMTGLLRTIQRPLSSIGRIFSEEDSSSKEDRFLEFCTSRFSTTLSVLSRHTPFTPDTFPSSKNCSVYI